MKNTFDTNLIKISNEYSILTTPSLLNKNIVNKTTIIYFDDYFIENDIISDLLNNKLVEKMVIISNNVNKSSNKKLLYYKHLNRHILKSLEHNIIILINPNNNYDYSKLIIKNLINLFKIASSINKNLTFNYSNSNVICSIFDNNSIYFNDIINCITAILMKTDSKKYEFIYDTVCDYLDSQFHNCNLCDFKNDQCVANRAKRTAHEFMGCCYSFNYAKLLDFRLLKDVKLCQYMQNRTCATKNITCKLFTCKYLKEKNIKFDTHKLLLLDCFFNKKQHDIIQSNFFRTREEILQKLQEKNHDLYYWYILRQKYRIKG